MCNILYLLQLIWCPEYGKWVLIFEISRLWFPQNTSPSGRGSSSPTHPHTSFGASVISSSYTYWNTPSYAPTSSLPDTIVTTLHMSVSLGYNILFLPVPPKLVECSQILVGQIPSSLFCDFVQDWHQVFQMMHFVY